uniref:Uncharacterized protein n=1 Tax=Cannabis sativa TaxID=3483 RepID=A0A803R6Y3_CANSA
MERFCVVLVQDTSDQLLSSLVPLILVVDVLSERIKRVHVLYLLLLFGRESTTECYFSFSTANIKIDQLFKIKINTRNRVQYSTEHLVWLDLCMILYFVFSLLAIVLGPKNFT